jgi:hypothetical protein
MIVGFTGTKHGMTESQKAGLRAHLERLNPQLFVHGACVGADDEADEIANELRIPRFVYPAKPGFRRVSDDKLHSRILSPVTIMAPSRPLIRNRIIAEACFVLIAAPRQKAEVIRSGTWHTIRRARSRGKIVEILYPE